MRKIIIIVVAVAAIAALVASKWRKPPLKVSGFIEADEIRVGSRVGGRVAKVSVQEGQRVKAGEVLFELEAHDLKERRAEAEKRHAADAAQYQKLSAGLRPEEIAQAQHRFEQLEFRLKQLKNGPRPQEIAAAEARVTAAKAQKQVAESNFKRVKDLVEKASASPLEMDRATDELASARANLDVRTQELSLLNAGTRQEEIDQAVAQLNEAKATLDLAKKGYRAEEIAAAKASMEAARATVNAIDRQIEELIVKSPCEATVEAVELQPGDLVAANAPGLSLMDASHLRVRAYVPENRLNLTLGKKMRVTVDSFPGKDFSARVSFVSRQAEFTPGNVQTPEERSKQVFRIKLTVNEGLDVLRPGMSADVWLD